MHQFNVILLTDGIDCFYTILKFFIGFKIVEGKIDYIKSNLNSNE